MFLDLLFEDRTDDFGAGCQPASFLASQVNAFHRHLPNGRSSKEC